MKIFLNIIFLFATIFSLRSQSWTQKNNFAGTPRYSSVGFSIGNKGYIGLGNDVSLNEFNDFWEWDQGNNTWVQIAVFPGTAREAASGFSIGNKGYVVAGYGSGSGLKELWEWDGDFSSPTYNTWTRKTDFPGQARVVAVAFSIGKKGYVGTGSYTQDFWEWDGDTASPTYDTWTKKADFGGGIRGWAMGFSVGNKGYIGTGTDGSQYKKDFWEWDGDISSPTYDTWIQKQDVPGGVRSNAVGFSIGNKGYVAAGLDSSGSTMVKGFWQWDPLANSWIQKPNFGGTARQAPVGFSIGNVGYVGTGYDNGNTKDFWEYCDTCPLISIEAFNKTVTLFLYPNPANTTLFIEQSNTNNVSEVKLFDLLGKGRIATELKGDGTSIDLSDLQNGVYFVSVKSSQGVFSKKIVIQH